MNDQIYGASCGLNNLTTLQMRDILQQIAEKKRTKAQRTFVVSDLVQPYVYGILIQHGFSVELEKDVQPSWTELSCRVWVLPTLRDLSYCEAVGDVVIRENYAKALLDMAISDPTEGQHWLRLAKTLNRKMGYPL